MTGATVHICPPRSHMRLFDCHSFRPAVFVFALLGVLCQLGCDEPQTGGFVEELDSSKGPGGQGGNAACGIYDNISDESLVFTIHDLVQSAYRPIMVEEDQGGAPNRYTTARRLMFTEVERKRGPQSEMVVECVYTGATAYQPPDDDPDRDAMNCEHIWPRSKLFEDQESALFSHQESDLHQLVPSLPGANSTRGNLPFGEVVGERDMDFAPSYRGVNARGVEVFEVRPERRGDVARIKFYMAIRWGLPLSPEETEVLRRWHQADPVSTDETTRNAAVQRLQGNRNPFVDCPLLVERIDAFNPFRPYDLNEAIPNP